MIRSVLLVELTVYENIVPLVSGYLQACALRDEELRHDVSFRRYSAPLSSDPRQVIDAVVAIEADVYAFSCYVWNTALIRRVVSALKERRPQAQILLGGYQVANEGALYISPTDERTAVCNGEGEQTFVGYLKELRQAHPDLSRVRGLSFMRDGQLITTPPHSKLMNLEEIPSPFLTGLFDGEQYAYAVFETNRGCPFECSFCAWGRNDSRVSKFDEQRVYAELDWLIKQKVFGIFLADANWGMLKRDIEFSRHIAKRKRETGFPFVLVANSAKNRADRLVDVAEILQGAGITTTQSIAVQSLSETTLRLIQRDNIKLSAYATAMQELDRKQRGSYIELIWPLPGETLQSFKDGVEQLCVMGAQSFIPYPLLLLHGTPMFAQRQELGLEVLPDQTGISECEVVVATAQVSREVCREGLWFCFALLTLYNCRTLYCVARHLAQTGERKFTDLFTDFAAFARQHPTNPVVQKYASSLEDHSYTDAAHWGRIVHYALFEYRREFRALLEAFVRAQPWYSSGTQALFEIDCVNAFYPYAPKEVDPAPVRFEHLVVARQGVNQLRVKLPAEWSGLVSQHVEGLAGQASDATYLINYKRHQMPYQPRRGLAHNASYCHAVAENVRNNLPEWCPAS